MCAEEGAFDGDIPEDDDGNTTNAFVSAHKFDMSQALWKSDLLTKVACYRTV